MQQLQASYANTRTEDLAKALGRKTISVHAKANALGLHKDLALVAAMARERSSQPGHGGQRSRFKAGSDPWNKGISYTAGGRSGETRFKPGVRQGKAAALVKPVGAFRINADGYLDLKHTDSGLMHKRWKAYHRVVWEAANGPVPDGHVVVFRQGMHTTVPEQVTLDRLELLTRQQLMARNSVHACMPPELASLCQLRGAITRQINRRLAQEGQPQQPQERDQP